jgi:hypothetical protein
MEVRWLTSPRLEHEGYPLYLRRPEYENIWDFQNKFPKLLTTTHKLDEVKTNGLPESDYNKSLADLDHKLVCLFNNNEGIIFLIETFGGERNYYYFISETVDHTSKVDAVRATEIHVNLEVNAQMDKVWKFLREYPVRIF